MEAAPRRYVGYFQRGLSKETSPSKTLWLLKSETEYSTRDVKSLKHKTMQGCKYISANESDNRGQEDLFSKRNG